MKHCWHVIDGVTLTCNPPIHPVRCCHCGAQGGVSTWEEETGNVISGHGQFGPKQTTAKKRYTNLSDCPADRIGKFADGGPLPEGTPYLVGE